MGLRSPLDSLPWVNESDYSYLNELDPTVERPPLPAREEFHSRSATVPAASSGGVSPLDKTRGETLRKPAGEDACATTTRLP